MLPSNGDPYAEQYYFLGDADIHHPPEHDPTSSPAFFAFSPENDEFPFLSPSSDPPALEWDRRSDYYYSSDKQIMDHYHQKQQIAASQEDSLPFNISPSKSKGKAALLQKSTGCSSAVGGGQKRRLAKKDRHSKIVTAHGPRDRRMRLSLQIARKFFDLQDMLGYDKASKTVEWLMAKSRPAIRDLSRGFSTRAAKSASSTSEWEATSGVDETADDDSCKSKPKPAKSSAAADKSKATRTARKAAQRPHARQSRAMARARARERTREKLLWSRRLEESQQWTEGSPLDESGSRVSHDKNEPSSQSPEQQKGSSVKDLVDDQSAPLSCNSGPAPIFNSISSHELINTHELVSLENHDMINYSFQQNWDMNGTASLQPSFMDGQASNRQWEAYINHSAC